MNVYKISIDDNAKKDIREAKFYYNKINPLLKDKFLNDLYASVNLLKSNPFYQVRYRQIHCLPLKKFPFMLHFSINEAESKVIIWAVISTHRDPSTTWVFKS